MRYQNCLRDFGPEIEATEDAQQAPERQGQRYVDLGRAMKRTISKEARENYLEATKLAPQDAGALLRLGTLCGQQQDSTCAIERFRKPGVYQAQSNLEGVLKCSISAALFSKPR